MKWLTLGPLPFCFRGPQPGGRKEDLLAHHPSGARAFIPKERSFRFILQLGHQGASRGPCPPPTLACPVARALWAPCESPSTGKAGEQKLSSHVDELSQETAPEWALPEYS